MLFIFNFSVGEPPELLSPLTDQTVVAPNEALMSCDIRHGDPPADIKW